MKILIICSPVNSSMEVVFLSSIFLMYKFEMIEYSNKQNERRTLCEMLTHSIFLSKINILKKKNIFNSNSYESPFSHRHANQVIKMSWLLLHPFPSPTWPFLALILTPLYLHLLHVISLPFSHSHSTPPLCPHPQPPICTPSSSLLSPFLPVFPMSLYQEEKRGSPEGLWFVPAAAYTGLMRSLREGVSVSVYVCVCLFLCLCLCSCD